MIRSVTFAVLLLLALAGCSPGNAPLATIGSTTVTVADYERAARGAEMQYNLPPEMAKAALVQDLTRRAAMLELAHRLGHDQSPVVKNIERQSEQRALISALVAQVASPAQRVSEAEARALYEARREQADVQVLQATTREGALAAKARLEAGEPFERVAQGYSMGGQVPPDGNMGPVSPGALPAPLDQALRTQKVGEVGGPYEMRDGWFLLKVKQRLPHEQGSWETMRAGMFDLMRQRKQRAAFDRAYRDFKLAYGMKLAPGSSQFLFHMLSPVQPLQPTPEQRKMPLATWSDGVFRVQDAMDIMADAESQRPPAQSQPAIELWLEAQVMTRIYVEEAHRRHLEEEPEVAAMIRGQRDQFLLEGIYQNAVAAVPPPGPELVAMAWERVKGQFQRLESVQLKWVETPDSVLAFKIGGAGKPGASLAQVAAAADAKLPVQDLTVSYPNTAPEWAAMEAMFTSMPEGAWFGPERRANGWRILQMVSRKRVDQDFASLPPALQQNIAGSAAELAREQRFTVFTDSLIAAYRPVPYPERVARLHWPVRAPLDVGR